MIIIIIISDTKNFKFKTLKNDNGKILGKSQYVYYSKKNYLKSILIKVNHVQTSSFSTVNSHHIIITTLQQI